MSNARVAWPVLGKSLTRRSQLSWLAVTVGVIALLGWAGDAAHLLAQSHGVASAVTLSLGGLSAALLAAFLATSAAVRWQRVQPRSADQCSHIHARRPGRDYFSPYSACSGPTREAIAMYPGRLSDSQRRPAHAAQTLPARAGPNAPCLSVLTARSRRCGFGG